MTISLSDPKTRCSATLAELRKLSLEAIQPLTPECSIWDAGCKAATERCKSNRIDVLLDEFRGQLQAPGEGLQYEHAFNPDWHKEYPRLYESRWWINERSGCVYFIYNDRGDLTYIGSCCPGPLGARVYQPYHANTTAIDVVLFDRGWSHFALAFEALAISRLRPPKNVKDRGFMRMWVEPPPPYDQVWSNPNG